MSKPTGTKAERRAELRWVPLADMRVNEMAQRDLVEARVDKLATAFDLEQFGAPTVNLRGGHYYIIDGQHRIEALRRWMGDGHWEDQSVQCFAYEGLTEEQEAEVFLRLNDTLTVNAMTKYRVGVEAGRPDETQVNKLVTSLGLRVSLERSDGAIGAVGTLMRLFRRAGPDVLTQTLRIVRDSYGDAGMEATVIDGLGLLCHRFAEEIDEEQLVTRLGSVRAGVAGLLNKADVLRRQTGNPKAHCVAAAAIEIHNGHRGGRRLPSWWKVATTAS